MLKILFNRNSAVIKSFHRCVSTASINPQGAEVTQFKEKYDAIKVPEKKPQREPLMKNFFIAKVDTELMAYPEAFYDNSVVNQATMRKNSYQDFLETNVYNNPNDGKNIYKLSQFGSFSCEPCLQTEELYANSEPEAKVLSYNYFSSNHKVIGEMISKYSSAEAKSKYLNKMSRGELLGSICLTESNPPTIENRPFNTIARPTDNDTWIVNGEKSYVLLNDLGSSIFLVVASIDGTNKIGDFEEKAALFLIDGSCPGVKVSDSQSTMGFNEAPFKRVTLKFNNVEISNDNFVTDDVKASLSLLNQMRLNMGMMTVSGVMKPLINKLTDYIINTKVQNIHFKDLDTLKERMGKLMANCYALESMVYLTAGLKDIYEDQDIDLECGVIKAFAVESLSKFITAPLNIVGPKSTITDEGYEKIIRDAMQLIGTEEPLETLKQFIGLNGMSHAGKEFNAIIKKQRSILDHPMFVFSRMRNEISVEDPKLKMDLWHYLHPSLRPASTYLEASIYRLRASIEILLGRYGTQIFQHSAEIGKVSEIATLCFAMFSASTRASRSYCIGLRNGDQEVYLSNAFNYDLSNRIKKIALDIDSGEHGTSMHVYKVVGEKLMETKKYQFEHPTTRNF